MIPSCCICVPTSLQNKDRIQAVPSFKEAMRSAQQAVKLRPALGPARGVLAKLYLQNGQFPEAAEQCRKALEIDPKDQTAVYHLIQALRKTDRKREIPELLKQLASLRQQATNEEREQYRYKLVEGDDRFEIVPANKSGFS